MSNIFQKSFMTESRTFSASQNSNPQKKQCFLADIAAPKQEKLELRSVQFQYKLAKFLFWWWKCEKRLVYLFYSCFTVDVPNKISFCVNSGGNFYFYDQEAEQVWWGCFFIFLFFLNLDV